MPTPLAHEFLAGFISAPYPARLTRDYDILECFSHSERNDTLLVRAKADGRLCVAKVGAETAETQPCILSLTHKGLPAVIDVFEDNGQTVLLREYVPGISAREALRRGPLTKKHALDVGVRLCDILRCLHAQKPPVIHRDVKPSNLILNGNDVYLIDFGIARSFTAGAVEDTVCFGTRDYAPPEQYGYSQTDTRADIYAFGATLYTLLTGRTDTARAAKTLRDPALRRIVRRCTAFSPQDRYKTIGRVRSALRRVRCRVWRLTAAAVAAAALAGGILAWSDLSGAGPDSFLPNTARFSDPLVGRAVCVALGKPEGARVTKAELAEVSALYIWQDEALSGEEAYESAKESWYGGLRSVGSLATLEDLASLPNLTALWLGASPDIDLSPLAETTRLSQLHLQQMNLSDLSVLGTLPNLSTIDLAGSRAADLSPLHDCHSVTRLALHDVPCHDYSFLQGLDNFDYVGLSYGDTAAFLQYFRGKSSNHLNLGDAVFSHMDWLCQVKDITVLELYNASLSNISGIDGLLHLKRLDLSDNPRLKDLSPLLNIRTLEELTLSKDMLKAADAIAAEAEFTILYRD